MIIYLEDRDTMTGQEYNWVEAEEDRIVERLNYSYTIKGEVIA